MPTDTPNRVDSPEMRAKGLFVASLKMRAYLAERRAVTETTAIRYQLASKRGKGAILDEFCANTGWHRNHARKALKAALQAKVVRPRRPRRASLINPAATQRQIQALTAQLLTITTTKAQVNKRARSHEATNPPSGAS